MPEISRIRQPAGVGYPVQGMLTGLWFGIVCGMVEGVTQLAAQAFIDSKYVSIHILWVAPSLYGLVFALSGAVAGLLGARLWPAHSNHLLLLLFIFLTIVVPLHVLLLEYAALYAILVLAAGLSVVVWRWLLVRLNTMLAIIRGTATRSTAFVLAAALLIPLGVRLHESQAVDSLPDASPGSPNIIVLVIDALRADHVSALGYERDTTPFLDELARQGVLFERAYATSPWTLPSHVSLMTGNTFDQHTVGWHNHQGLRDYPHPLLPELLQHHGYRTGAFAANNFWVTHDRMGRGFHHFDDFFFNTADAVLRTLYGRAFEEFVLQKLGFEDIPARRHAADINRAFMQWAGRHPGRPFFALLNYMDVHDPYLPPAPYQ